MAIGQEPQGYRASASRARIVERRAAAPVKIATTVMIPSLARSGFRSHDHTAWRRSVWQLGVVGHLPSEIVTPRLLLRLWRPDDAAALGAAIKASYEHLRPWLSWIRFEPLSDEDRVRLINSGRADWQNGGDANYGAVRDGVIVGGCGLHHRQGPGVLDLGYWIHVDHTGQGYAVEMARALTAAAFDMHGIERVEIHHDKANVASRAVPRSLGFTAGPEQPDGVESPGESGIDCSWSISRTAWKLNG
jgi:ribosomal-protein-serine acetyltransferase